jgi:hypothetical protein
VSVMQKKSVEIPAEVQEAWDKVAEFLNGRPELTFFISPWTLEYRERRYTLHNILELHDVAIIANNSWEGRK